MTARNTRAFHFRGSALRPLSVLLCLFVIQLFGAVKATATEYNLHVGPTGWVPFVMVKRDGNDISHYGVMFDFLDQFEAAHPEFSRKNILSTRKRVNAMMSKGETIDVMLNSPLFVSPEVLNNYIFTETLVKTNDKVISLKGKNFEYETPHDLIGKKVGTIRGYSYGHFDFLLNFDFFDDIRVDSHSQAIGMLKKNRIDAYIGNSLVSPFYMHLSGLDLSDFVFHDVPLYDFNIAFAVSKQKPELYEKLNKFVVEFVADGKFDALLNNYLEKYLSSDTLLK